MTLPLFALFLAAFSIGTTEFVITGILPDVAADLGVSIPTAGYLISGYAVGVAVGGPIMALITSNLERRSTLLGLMAIFIAGNALCGLAPTYGWLMAARIVVSLSHGAFFGIALVIAANLVPEERHASAISMVIAGINVANVFGVPIGTAIGHNFGWRMSFWAITALGVVATGIAAVCVPRQAAAHHAKPDLGAQFRVLGKHEVYLPLTIIVVAVVGFFGIFAYIAPVLTEVSGASPLALPWLLSIFGIGALIGNLAGGRLADWKLMPSLIGILVLLVAVDVVLLFILPYLVPATVTLFVWSFANFAFAAPLQSRILKGSREAPNLAASLVSSAFNVGISVGAAIGAMTLTAGLGYGQLPWLGLAGAVPALGLAFVALALDRRDSIAATAMQA